MVQAQYTLEQAEEDLANLRGQMAYLGETGSALNFGIPGASGATFPGTTVTAASLTSIASATIPANAPVAGAVYELETWGNGTQGSTAQTLQLGAALGGSAMASVILASGSMAINATFRWRALIRVICNTTGATGTWTSYVKANWTTWTAGGSNIGPNNNNFSEAFSCESTGTTTADTTASQALAVQAAWGATTGGPTLTSRVALFRRIA